MWAIMDVIHKIPVRIANREDRSSLIWVCAVCLGLFGRQLVFKILEHLPYLLLEFKRILPELWSIFKKSALPL